MIDNLQLGAYLRYKKETKAQTSESIEENFSFFLILKERQDQIAGTMSGGEQKMLAIGRALVLKPKILVLDEPSMELAPVIIDEVFNIIKRIKDAKLTTILLVEQLAYRASAVADRAYVLEQGEVRIQGTGEEIRNSSAVKSAYLGG